MLRVGYPCMNLVLGAGTNGTLRLASLGDEAKLRAVVERNFGALERILPFNDQHGVRLFRLGSQFIPFASHPAFPYDWRKVHGAELARLGKLAKKHGQRLSVHPGQYVCPGSGEARVVEASLAELRYAADVVTIMDAESPVVLIHVGGAYGDKAAAADRFVRALEGEREILRVLALENDERVWSPGEVIPIARRLGVGAIVDTLHWRLNPGGMALEDAVREAAGTWGSGRGSRGRPKLHISSQDPAKVRGAHAYGIEAADWAELLRVTEGLEVDVMVEAKGKEQALRGLGWGTIPAVEGEGIEDAGECEVRGKTRGAGRAAERKSRERRPRGEERPAKSGAQKGSRGAR
jgi:UV DNA damage endonuclease